MEHVVARRLEVVDKLRDRLGQDGAAAVSVKDVADAFVRGQVDTLLLDLDAAAEVQIDPANHPGLAFGSVVVDGPVRADLGLVAAAVTTGADVRVVPEAALRGEPAGALLRWEQSANGPS